MASQLPPGIPLSQIPAARPPQGVIPNFINPPSLDSAVIGVCTVFIALTVFFVLNRLYLNGHAGQKLALDDCIFVSKSSPGGNADTGLTDGQIAAASPSFSLSPTMA